MAEVQDITVKVNIVTEISFWNAFKLRLLGSKNLEVILKGKLI